MKKDTTKKLTEQRVREIVREETAKTLQRLSENQIKSASSVCDKSK